MDDPRIGTHGHPPAQSVGGAPYEAGMPLMGLDDTHIVALDYFPRADADAVIASLRAGVTLADDDGVDE